MEGNVTLGGGSPVELLVPGGPRVVLGTLEGRAAPGDTWVTPSSAPGCGVSQLWVSNGRAEGGLIHLLVWGRDTTEDEG